ncbi:Eco57I restriction-modification methylase domain-containing protein [Roseococcus suduntuyensis]|uniref:site-specific DNA-methyltransferase (adenine-specific) n=1 Tax=Roseococcus suduntuyensis TaxID=455361 RepID=A0A840A520_9PROT|nr:N-6 DNA methylase [Roseococcus suduntuyensis]MBB3896609.1 hypothetical protein [Roseococcus suduntuyensis]
MRQEPFAPPLPVGPEREQLRTKGQFWTPAWVARGMVAWALQGTETLFDPAVGPGAFFDAGKYVGQLREASVKLKGAEIDSDQIAAGIAGGLSPDDYAAVTHGNYMSLKFDDLPCIVANPPYIRHHRMPPDEKLAYQENSSRIIGRKIDGRAGLHVHFLIKSLTELKKAGRLCYILPSDVCEGKYSDALWSWISQNFRINAAVTFRSSSSPFPGIDTNPIIICISNEEPAPEFVWAQVKEYNCSDFFDFFNSNFSNIAESISAKRRQTLEAIRTGLSRPPQMAINGIEFGKLFKVMRGIATGDNSFFFLTLRQIQFYGLETKYFRRGIARTRDHASPVLRHVDLDRLDEKGRPTYLLSFDARGKDIPASLLSYIRRGEDLGLPQRPLIAQRSPWYKMEQRVPPPWLFAYLGRRECRFIRNEAEALPLTGFLCIYQRDVLNISSSICEEILSDPDILTHLALVAKSYGQGSLKVEPRNLEKLMIPHEVLLRAGLSKY